MLDLTMISLLVQQAAAEGDGVAGVDVGSWLVQQSGIVVVLGFGLGAFLTGRIVRGAELATLRAEHATAMAAMRVDHASELAEVRAEHVRELASANARLAETITAYERLLTRADEVVRRWEERWDAVIPPFAHMPAASNPKGGARGP